MAPEKEKTQTDADERLKRQFIGDLVWRLPPLAWILSAGRPQPHAALSRVLVCRAIPEALILAKSLPDTDFIVIDSSPEALRLLQIAAKRRRLANLEALTASLEQPALAELTGRNFDLVLAFFDQELNFSACLENLQACASRIHGTVYVRFPGPGHPLRRLDKILPDLGLESGTSTRKNPLLELLSAMGGDPFQSNLQPDPEWGFSDVLQKFTSGGFHYAASLHVPETLTRSLNAGGLSPLTHLSREALGRLIDHLGCHPIHQVIFSTQPCPEPPWAETDALGAWRPFAQYLPRTSIPPQEAPFDRALVVDVSIHGVLSKIQMNISSYVLELLRNSDGQSSLQQLMLEIPSQAPLKELVPALFFFFHSTILNLLPPKV